MGNIAGWKGFKERGPIEGTARAIFHALTATEVIWFKERGPIEGTARECSPARPLGQHPVQGERPD